MDFSKTRTEQRSVRPSLHQVGRQLPATFQVLHFWNGSVMKTMLIPDCFLNAKDSLVSVKQTVLFDLFLFECHRARDISDRWIDVKKCSLIACGLPRLKIQRKFREYGNIHLHERRNWWHIYYRKIPRRFTNGNNAFACINVKNASINTICEPHEWSLCLSHNQSWFASLWWYCTVDSFYHLLPCPLLAYFLSSASLCRVWWLNTLDQFSTTQDRENKLKQSGNSIYTNVCDRWLFFNNTKSHSNCLRYL